MDNISLSIRSGEKCALIGESESGSGKITPFLVPDEGTSALDQQTAEEIEGELMAISELTLLTITHNLRKTETYDHIFDMAKANTL